MVRFGLNLFFPLSFYPLLGQNLGLLTLFIKIQIFKMFCIKICFLEPVGAELLWVEPELIFIPGAGRIRMLP